MTKERSSRPRPLYTSVPPALAHAHFKGGIYDGSHFDPARSYRSWRVLSGHCQYNATGFWLLTIVESIIVVILVGFFFSYRGKRRSRFYDPDIGARPYTIRFSIIAVSLFVNGAALFVYIMAIRGNSIFKQAIPILKNVLCH